MEDELWGVWGRGRDRGRVRNLGGLKDRCGTQSILLFVRLENLWVSHLLHGG